MKKVYEDADLALSLDGGSSWIELAALANSVSIDIEMSSGEVKNFDSQGWMELVRGGRAFSGSIDAYTDLSVIGFSDIIDLVEAEMCQFRVRPDGTGNGLDQILFSGLVEGAGLEFNVDDPGAFTLDFNGSGKPTTTVQA